MPRIALEGVWKTFAAPDGKSVTAVDHLNLAVEDRELFVLVGPSGCGKTTTLRLVAGLETVDAGRILFDDQPVTTLSPVDRGVAMVFQSDALFPHLTAFDNLAFGLKLRRVPEAEINARVREVAELLGVTYCLSRKPGKLSGGERQRLALGRALVRRPKILLLDEPFAHLDEPLRIQLRTELLTLRTRLGMTVIYVTHDQTEALALGDRVAAMCQGRIHQVDRPTDIYTSPADAFVAGFIGSPPMNLFHVAAAQWEGRLVLLDAETAPEALPPAFVLPLGGWRADWFSQNLGRHVLLGVRPEHIRLTDGDVAVRPERALVAEVRTIHYLGAETILRLIASEHPIVARTRSPGALQPGQRVSLQFDLERARVYDAVTGTLLF
jgi:multiple sugar transport system ATP-binding protein